MVMKACHNQVIKMKTGPSLSMMGLTFILVVGLIASNLMDLPTYASVPAEPHLANAMWIEPSLVKLSTENHEVGYRFNVTVWVNITSVSSSTPALTAWQFVLVYDKSHLNATKCGYTEGTKSQFFSNITAVSVEPQFGPLNTTHDFVMHGETWILGPKRTVPGYGSLSWLEFEVIAKPSEGQIFISLIGLVTTGIRVCKILDDELNKVPFAAYHCLYSYGANTYNVPIKGGKNATISGNVNVTKILVTKNTLHFDASGPLGTTGWINVTFPAINTTQIKVFINGEKLAPPPFPIVTANGTHYFIYFEFSLSTHTICIQFWLLGDITGPDGEPDSKVDIRDVATVAKAFGSYPSHPLWNPICDLTGPEYLTPDDQVDIRDIALVAKNFGESA